MTVKKEFFTKMIPPLDLSTSSSSPPPPCRRPSHLVQHPSDADTHLSPPRVGAQSTPPRDTEHAIATNNCRCPAWNTSSMTSSTDVVTSPLKGCRPRSAVCGSPRPRRVGRVHRVGQRGRHQRAFDAVTPVREELPLASR